MLFNSWGFLLFFLAVFTAYWALRGPRWQNPLLLAASYYFYAAWDWRFCSLILAGTVADYTFGAVIHRSSNPRLRKALLLCSVCFNLGLLGFFKYYNFFVENLGALLSSAGIPPELLGLQVILPVGISFFTFQSMTYTIDIYREEMEPARHFLDFALYIAFFPQLIAGPIERARHLLPQIERPRSLDLARFQTGLWLIAWGLWKKVFVADNLAPMADAVFARSASATLLEAYLGVLAFAFQIYCDFSAYSDIARGGARLLGFDLMRNFDLPYFATDPSDFWRRWHISLSTWLRDYLYIPMGGNRGGTARTYVNLMKTMILGGLWHGASWNFVWWGTYHGALLCGHRALAGGGKDRARPGRRGRLASMLVMFQFTLFGWLLFRCNRRTAGYGGSRDESWNQIVEMVTSYRNGLGFDAASLALAGDIAFFSLPLIVVQVLQYTRDDHYVVLKLPRPARVVLLAVVAFTWIMWGVQAGNSFIYFQF